MQYRGLSIIIHLGAKIMNVYRWRALVEKNFSIPFWQGVGKEYPRNSQVLGREYPYSTHTVAIL